MTMNNKEMLEPLLIALRSERQAIEYYTRAAKRIVNPTGKKTLEKIRRQEEGHFKNLKNKFKKMTGRELRPGEEHETTAAISSLTEEHLADREVSDIEVCQIAIKDEQEAHDFYLKSADRSLEEETRKLYEELAAEEKRHAETIQKLCEIIS